MSTCRLRMTKFRLKMDMSQFYDDERNLAYILVDPKWERVLCLQEHVEKLFDVSSVNFLTIDGIYIPPKESIDIIKSSDVLRAIVPQKVKKRKKKIRSCLYDGFGDGPVAEEILEVVGEKRRHEDEKMLTCSTPNAPPSKKMKTRDESALQADNSSPQVLVDSPKPEQCSENSGRISSPNNSSGGEVLTVANEETTKTRKRKRMRKKKTHQGAPEITDKSARLSSVPVPISSSTLRLSKAMCTPKNQSLKHVRFDENSTPVPGIVQSNENRVIYRCVLNADGMLQPREIEAEEVEEGAPPPKKPKIQIHENILLVKGNDSFYEQTEHNGTSVIEVEDSMLVVGPVSEGQQKSLEVTVVEPRPVTITVNTEKILPLSEPLVGLPGVGDIVLFKIYRLSETCTPEVSGCICVRCEGVDATKGTMTCLVLDGLDQVDDTDPTTTLGNGDGGATHGKINFVLDQLLDKRIFRMT